jgi:hypothetical protein
MLLTVTAANLFPSPAVIHFRPERNTCPACHESLKVQKTQPGKRAATLAIGDFIAHETVYYCPGCGGVFHSAELRALIPESCNFGYDIIVFVGKSMFLRCRNYQEIRLELQRKNVRISESEISFLAKKFVLYLGLLHKSVQRKTKKYMHMNGGYILHLDGTCDGGSPHLISVLDGITEIVLDNRKLPSENAEDLIPFLESIKKSYGVPLAVVSDMGKGIALAVKEVFKNVSAFICHYHFLKAVGKNLFGNEKDIIRERLRKHNVRAVLKRTKSRLEKLIGGSTNLLHAMVTGIEGERLPAECPLGGVPAVAAYTLVSWALEAKSEGNGFGFPFDQSYLVFYQRLQEISLRLHRLYRIQLQGDWKENKVYSKISHDLVGVINDSVLCKAALKMEGKVAVFNRLRKAMRITLPENKRGLNDNGELPTNMKTIKKEVAKFRAWLSKSKEHSEHKEYQKMVEQINTYWEKLFADPIVVKTAAGRMLVQPQRTNNILEQFFRKLMRTYRKKNGFSSMERVLRTMLPDTPLTMNLKNQKYMQILLAGKKTLEERFAEIDSKEVRRSLEKSRIETSTIYPQLKKIIRLPDLPKSIVSLLEQAAS